jgi:hypothetical protein
MCNGDFEASPIRRDARSSHGDARKADVAASVQRIRRAARSDGHLPIVHPDRTLTGHSMAAEAPPTPSINLRGG